MQGGKVQRALLYTEKSLIDLFHLTFLPFIIKGLLGQTQNSNCNTHCQKSLAGQGVKNMLNFNVMGGSLEICNFLFLRCKQTVLLDT